MYPSSAKYQTEPKSCSNQINIQIYTLEIYTQYNSIREIHVILNLFSHWTLYKWFLLYLSGPRPPLSDPIGAPSPSSTASVFRKELITDLSAEGIRKEAAKVLAQVDSVECTAEGASNDIVGGRVNTKSRGPIEKRRTFDYNTNKIFNKDSGNWLSPNRFNSLPSRRPKSKAGSKPVTRSVSDASAKKSAAKRPTIFNIFSRKSDSNLHESSAQGDGDGPVNAKSDSATNRHRKRVGRSKSDVGAQSLAQFNKQQQLQPRKRNYSENEDHVVGQPFASGPKKNRAPLSPIIEQSQREDYFTESSGKPSVPAPVVPQRRDKRNGNRSNVSRATTTREATTQEDTALDIVPTKPVAEAIKDTISTLKRSNSRTAQEMHSSQQPQTKPPLTKGVTVDGMVKRLSMERFSPPPHLSGPAFSYTRPKDQVIYAQVVCDTDGKSKQTIHSSYENGTVGHEKRGPSPARNGVKSPSSHNLDAVDGPVKTQTAPAAATSQLRRTQHSRHNSDEDEGLGLEIKAKALNDDFIPTHDRRYVARDLRSTGSDDDFKSAVAEDLPITPKLRDVPPEKYVFHSEATMRGRGDGVEGKEFGDLSQRRAVLESRIQNRRYGSRDLLTEQKGDDEPLFKNPAYHHHTEYPTGDPVQMTKVSTSANPTTNRDYVKRLSPPSRETDHHLHHQHHQQAPEADPQRYQRSRSMDVTGAGDRQGKRYHQLGSRELLDRYSPERSHLDMVSGYPHNGGGAAVSTKYEEESRYYHDGREGYKETVHRETSIGPDGKPRVSESVSRERLDTPRSNRRRGDEYSPDKYVREPSATDLRRPIDTEQLGEDDLIRRHYHHRQEWRSSSEPSRRHQKLQRSFDRGDSGIENDYRKDSFNDRDQRNKWKQRTYDDDRRACESFLRKERRHTTENHPVQWTRSYGYRERSIDDGSHFDPRLDRYPDDQGTLRRRREKSAERSAAEKKKSGLEKVSVK